MRYVNIEEMTQELAVLRKIHTGETAPYDRTLSILSKMPPHNIVPNDICARLFKLAMAADRPIIEELKASVGAARDQDVKFSGATAEYMLKIANVLYA